MNDSMAFYLWMIKNCSNPRPNYDRWWYNGKQYLKLEDLYLEYQKSTTLRPIPKAELDELLMWVSGILNGWHEDGTAWSEWDESVRNKVNEFRKKYTYRPFNT